jgi:hypothetical protein
MVGSYKLSKGTHVENTRSQLTWTMCSVQLVNPLWMSQLFGSPVIGRKLESYIIAQIGILCLAQFLDMHSVALFIWSSSLNTCFSKCTVLWNRSCGCFRKACWLPFWAHILNYFATILHCNNGVVGSVHSQSSFLNAVT